MIKKIIPNDISNRVFSYPSTLYHYHHALLIPQTPIGVDKRSGLYDCHGNLINQAAIFSGENNNLHIHVQEYKTEINFHDEYPEFDQFFWGGYFSDHYGHFLIETLPRLIRYSFIKNEKNIKIVFLSKKSKNQLKSTPWIRFFLKNLEIELDDIFIPTFPVKINNIYFCQDYISEQNYINNDCKRLFKVLSQKNNNYDAYELANMKIPFAYISRRKLNSGTHKISNEQLLEEKLINSGVSIFYPEELSPEDQIKIVNNYKLSGFLGSFFHNYIFSKEKRHFLCLSYGEEINLNYSLLDYASEGIGDYYVPDLEIMEKTEGFYETTSIKNIEETHNFIMEWFSGKIDPSPSYIFQEKCHSYPEETPLIKYEISDHWGRVAKLSPHTGRIIFSERETENDVLINVIISQYASEKFFITADSSYLPPVKIGKYGQLKKFIPVKVEKQDNYVYIRDTENVYMTAVPKNGYSVSETRHSQPDTWEQFSLREIIR